MAKIANLTRNNDFNKLYPETPQSKLIQSTLSLESQR